MEWLLFTYWLPPEPSRKRVFIWRQLKKIGALSTEGGGWLLPKSRAVVNYNCRYRRQRRGDGRNNKPVHGNSL